jgi:hypothetical protein
MRGRGKEHPPKKKHENKPRQPPIVPLTDAERGAIAQQEFEKAMIHLIEAERMAEWGRSQMRALIRPITPCTTRQGPRSSRRAGLGRGATCRTVMSM